MRQATERFQDVEVAKAEGYALQFGCVSGSESGAMGMHFVNGALVGDGELDPTRPEIVIYEPMPNGKLKLIGADFLVLADAWNAKHAAPPEMKGQLFHLFEVAEPFRASHVLHAARVGVEGQPDRRVRELAPERVVQRLRGQAGLMTRSTRWVCGAALVTIVSLAGAVVTARRAGARPGASRRAGLQQLRGRARAR